MTRAKTVKKIFKLKHQHVQSREIAIHSFRRPKCITGLESLLFTQLLSLNRLARRLLTICKNLGKERVTQIVDKE